MDGLTSQEMELINILRDPVLFAEHHLNWKARWYQEAMLRDPSIRKVSRCGRRIGKLLAPLSSKST